MDNDRGCRCAGGQAGAGRRMLRRPECDATLTPWSQARPRTVRDLGGDLVAAKPDRVRRRSAHVVLDADLLPRLVHTVRFLGQALMGAVPGHGHRQTGAKFGVADGTVCDCLLWARSTAEHCAGSAFRSSSPFNAHALPATNSSGPVTHTIEVLVVATVSAQRRFGHGSSNFWPQIALLTCGHLLAPSLTC
ncbi:hypothetical protein ACIQWZ_35945 [Streptomyces sp. NPDC098077]|uniref:hypothetical protein n=1 Tax=Streptomyces sp. NPDC098077 TaxID=3366093 RepID=UPI003817B623